MLKPAVDWTALQTFSFDGVLVQSVLVLDANAKVTGRQFLKETIPNVRALFPGVPIGGGTAYHFAEFNRQHPPADLCDFLAFSGNPQVHAFDDASIIETAHTFADQGKTAHEIGRSLPLHMGTITLRPRLNPNATDPARRVVPFQHRVDLRQRLPLTALWTLAAYKYATLGGVAQLTFFESVGEEGVIMPSAQPRMQGFQMGETFPVYEAIEVLASLRGSSIRSCESSHPHVFDGFVARQTNQTVLVLINFSADKIDVFVQDKIYALPPLSFRTFSQDC
jgi:hypothetical protein